MIHIFLTLRFSVAGAACMSPFFVSFKLGKKISLSARRLFENSLLCMFFIDARFFHRFSVVEEF
jgi:hypothetical protein